MPDELEPVAAARMLLISTAEFVDVVDDKSELTAEVVLIASTYIPGRRYCTHAYPLGPGQTTGSLRVGREQVESSLKIRIIGNEAEVAPCCAPPP
jgi:hypothetical protein